MGGLFGKPSVSHSVEYRTDPALAEQIRLLTENLSVQKAQYDAIARAMEEKKIESFDDLQAQDATMAAHLLKLARETPAVPMAGHNVGFFGNTSVGKSKLLNVLHGSEVAESGVGETTMVITKYESAGVNLWDLPGKNDMVNYYTLAYVSCIKALSKRVVMVSHTIKEMSKIISMFRELGLAFCVVVNKMDLLDEDELAVLKSQILAEASQICPGVDIFFVAAKKPTLEPHAAELRRLTMALAPPSAGLAVHAPIPGAAAAAPTSAASAPTAV